MFHYVFILSGEGRGKKNTDIRCLSALRFRYEFTKDFKFIKDSQNVNRIQCGSTFTGIRQALGVKLYPTRLHNEILQLNKLFSTRFTSPVSSKGRRKKFISSKIVKRGEKERKLESYFRKFFSYFLQHILPSFIAPLQPPA